MPPPPPSTEALRAAVLFQTSFGRLKRPGEPDCTWADTTKISRELKWAARVSFEEGVKRVLADIAYWRDAPLWDPESITEATRIWFTYLGLEKRV